VDYDGKPLEDAARDVRELAEENEKAGKQAEETARDTKALGEEQEKAGRKAEEAARDAKKLGDAVERTGDQAVEAAGDTRSLADETAKAGGAAGGAAVEVDKLEKSSGFLRTGFDSLVSTVRGLVGGLVGVGGLIAVWRANREEMEANVRVIRELAEAQRDFLFLSSGNTAEELDAIKDAAEIVGGKGSRALLTRTFTQLKSQTADLSEEERLGLFQQLIETSLTTSTSPTDLVELYSKGIRYEPDPQRLQNIIAQTIRDNPESSPAVVGRLLPQLLPVGSAAGLTAAESAGAFSFAAGAAGSPEQGATGLRNIILALRGRGTPESREILERVGAGPDLNFFGQLSALGSAFDSGQLNLPDLESIGGRENTALLSALLRGRGDLNANVRRAVSASTGEDITRVTLERTLDEFATQNIELLTRQAEARVESMRLEDTDAQRAALGRLLFEEALRRNNALSPYRRGFQLIGYDVLTGFGLSPENAVGAIEPTGTDLFSDPVAAGLNGRANIDVSRIGRGGTSGGGGTVINNYGTTIHQGKDPYTSDLGRPRE
jgi:hypothetical protein